MANRNIDVAIIGGGLVGMMSAYYLANENLKIAIFDKTRVATESSWAGGGILTPLYPWRYADSINTLAFRSQRLYPALITQLTQDSGLDPEYWNSGMLISAKDINPQAHDWLKANDVLSQKVNIDDYPSLSNDDVYYLLPNICQVRNPRLVATLNAALQNKNVIIHEGCGVENIVDQSGAFKLSTTQGGFSAAKVIVSAGAWSEQLLSQLGVSISVRPMRGQMLLFKMSPDFLSTIILADGKYIIPRRDGHVLVGSTMEDVGFDKQTTQVAYDKLMAFAQSRCAGLTKQYLVKSWAGLRPASPEGIPYIFQHPKAMNLFVNTGHFRNGVVLAPASAELMKDLVLGHRPAVLPSDYAHGLI